MKDKNIREEKKNIHFMIVTELYRFDIPRVNTRKKAYERLLTTHNKSPIIEASLPAPETSDVKIIDKTPTKPIITPPVFLNVIGSFRKKNEMIIARIGVIVITIEALVAEVICNPEINAAWLSPTPKSDPRKRVPISFRDTFSDLRNIESNQKAIAPKAKRE